MSEVISFRLDISNPREARALEVLNAWIEEGFSVRFIITTALIKFDQHGSTFELSQNDHNLDFIIDQITQLIELVKSMDADSPKISENDSESHRLHEVFLSSVKLGVKQGLKLE